VHAERPRAAGRQPAGEPGRAAQRGGQPRHRRGDERGQERGAPSARQAGRHRRPASRVGGHQLDAEVTVDLEIHQARDEHPGVQHQVRAAGRRPLADVGDDAVSDPHEAWFEDAGTGHGGDDPRRGDDHSGLVNGRCAP
jgi:hypothetical protein